MPVTYMHLPFRKSLFGSSPTRQTLQNAGLAALEGSRRSQVKHVRIMDFSGPLGRFGLKPTAEAPRPLGLALEEVEVEGVGTVIQASACQP